MNIVLCGFMGCGKSTVGKMISQKENKKFVDLDTYIIEKEAMSINEIFDEKGEEYFRDLETKAIKEIIQSDDSVIALGGGAVLKKENVDLLKSNGKIILLDVSAQTVYDRLKSDTSRPLLNTKDKLGEITKRLTKRTPIYQAVADEIVDANGADATTLATQIIKICK